MLVREVLVREVLVCAMLRVLMRPSAGAAHAPQCWCCSCAPVLLLAGLAFGACGQTTGWGMRRSMLREIWAQAGFLGVWGGFDKERLNISTGTGVAEDRPVNENPSPFATNPEILQYNWQLGASGRSYFGGNSLVEPIREAQLANTQPRSLPIPLPAPGINLRELHRASRRSGTCQLQT